MTEADSSRRHRLHDCQHASHGMDISWLEPRLLEEILPHVLQYKGGREQEHQRDSISRHPKKRHREGRIPENCQDGREERLRQTLYNPPPRQCEPQQQYGHCRDPFKSV